MGNKKTNKQTLDSPGSVNKLRRLFLSSLSKEN